MSVYTQRIKIPYASFDRNPIQSIKELLGQHVKILSYTDSDMILDDDTVVVDVRYQNTIEVINPEQLFFVNMSETKSLNGSEYVAIIENQPVKFRLPLSMRSIPVVPLSVNAQLPTTNGENVFNYFGIPVRNALHSICTPLKYPGYQCSAYETKMPDKLYDNDYETRLMKNIDDQVKATDQKKVFGALPTIADCITRYQQQISRFPILQYVTNIIYTGDYKNITDTSNTAYIIDYRTLPIGYDINGVILASRDRSPVMVLYMPTVNYMLLSPEVYSLKKYLDADLINYINYSFITSK